MIKNVIYNMGVQWNFAPTHSSTMIIGVGIRTPGGILDISVGTALSVGWNIFF